MEIKYNNYMESFWNNKRLQLLLLFFLTIITIVIYLCHVTRWLFLPLIPIWFYVFPVNIILLLGGSIAKGFFTWRNPFALSMHASAMSFVSFMFYRSYELNWYVLSPFIAIWVFTLLLLLFVIVTILTCHLERRKLKNNNNETINDESMS